MDTIEAQLNYLRARLEEVVRDRVKAKEQTLFGPAGVNGPPSWGLVFEAIRDGSIQLKPEQVDSTAPYLKPQDVVWPQREKKRSELEQYSRALIQHKVTIMDRARLSNPGTTDLVSLLNDMIAYDPSSVQLT